MKTSSSSRNATGKPQWHHRWMRAAAASFSAAASCPAAIVTISPNNPTGAVYDRHVLEEINQLCSSRGLYHICDEAYEYFVYDELQHFSPASLAGSAAHTIGLYSLSKTYGLAGWAADGSSR